MVQPLLPVPEDAKFALESLGISKAYESFLTSVFEAQGGSIGTVQFSENTIQPKDTGSDIKITPESNRDLYLNSVRWLTEDGNTNEGLAGSSTSSLTLSDLETLGFGDTSGDIRLTYKSTPDSGWIMLDDGTIGNALSGATNLASENARALYVTLWNNISNTYAPVSGGRGASATVDFNLNKTIQLPSVLGRAFAVAGAGSGLTSRSLGQDDVGEEGHTITLSEFPAHTHTMNVWDNSGSSSQVGIIGDSLFLNAAVSLTTTDTLNADLNTADTPSDHENMGPTGFIRAMIKL